MRSYRWASVRTLWSACLVVWKVCRVENGSVWHSPRRHSPTRRCCCVTNPHRGSTRSWRTACCRFSKDWRWKTRPSSWPFTNHRPNCLDCSIKFCWWLRDASPSWARPQKPPISSRKWMHRARWTTIRPIIMYNCWPSCRARRMKVATIFARSAIRLRSVQHRTISCEISMCWKMHRTIRWGLSMAMDRRAIGPARGHSSKPFCGDRGWLCWRNHCWSKFESSRQWYVQM